ncbi:MAG: AI-2E family transporter [Alphaproteobacteria bacterium]
MSPERQMRFWFVGLIVMVVLLYVLRSVLLPFVAGMAIAYLCDPIVDRLVRWKFPRVVATLTVIGSAVLAIAAILALMVPLLLAQISGFIGNLPGYAQSLQELLDSLLGAAGERIGQDQVAKLQAAASEHLGAALSAVADFLGGLLSRGLALINLLSLLFITPIVAFYLLRDWDDLVSRIDSLVPLHHSDTIREQLRLMDRKLAGFVRGQAMVSAILGAYYALALTVSGLEFGLVVGLGAGAVSFIPYVGSTSGFIVSVGLALIQFDSLAPVGIVAGIFILGQIVEGNFLTPKLVGEQVGLHPVWVIFALLAGGALLGLLGLLLALPVAAVASVLVAFGLDRYRGSVLYHGGRDVKSSSEEPEA